MAIFLLLGIPFVINMLIPLEKSDEKEQNIRMAVTAILGTLMILLFICASVFNWIPHVPKEEWDIVAP